MNDRRRSLPLMFLLLLPGLLLQAVGGDLLEDHLQAAPGQPGADGSSPLQYAPSREVDIQHLALDITPDFKRRTIEGTATLTFTPIARPLAELRLDGVDLEVRDVQSSEPLQAWQATERKIVITFSAPISPDHQASLSIRYSAAPRKGLYFRTPELGYAAADLNLWSQGEPIESRHWFPSFDAPNEKFTSELTCRVPSDMTVLSNGHLVSSETNAATGLKAVRWLQDKPHSNYLIALAAGYLKGIEDRYRNIPIALYTPASEIAYAPSTFSGLKEILAFFEEEIGVPYPWDKYYQVCVSDYHWGGMENTSLTILNDRTLYPSEGFEELRSSESLVAHELAHQWFGDYVTCKDWSHLWLNEGFATYYDALYQGHKHGRDELLYVMRGNASGVLGAADDHLPIVHRRFAVPEEQFSFRAYPKGAWVLHMVRSQLGEELYRRCVKTYLDRHKFGNVDTHDFSSVIEELSGRSFDAFFDQYVYHAQQPDLAIAYEWQEREKVARVSIQQNQKVGDDVLIFTLPAKIRFKGKFGVIDREFTVAKKSEEFFFPLPQAPEVVRFDPDYTILAKVSLPLPSAMLHAQLGDSSDVIGRLLAVEQLAKKSDPETIARLKHVLNTDPFYGVRMEASSSLRQFNTPESRDALKASLRQPDARVRRRVLMDATGPYLSESLATALEALKTERNPDILASLFQALAPYSRPEIKELLLSALATNSYHAVLAGAAITAIRAQDNPEFIPALQSALSSHEQDWPKPTFLQGVSALGWMARNEEHREGVRTYLTGLLASPLDTVQRAAIQALRSLGDPQATAALERFLGLAKEDPLRTEAQTAINDLRATRKPSVELGTVRTDLLALQQENKDLKKELEALKKKMDSLAAQSTPAAPTNTHGRKGSPAPVRPPPLQSK